MVRKLVRTLLSLSLVSPVSVWGLGLGEIHLHSALNEKLNAEIELLSVEAGDLERMEVELASYDAFKRFGLERLGTLALLDFTVKKGANGRPYIHVTSKQTIREPFLDFLVQVDWRQGKLLREYTLLLDPPELAQRRAPVTTAPVATAPRAGSQPAKRAPQRSAAAGSGGPGRYGPVGANETLWSIAKQMRPDSSVTVNQMMMALFEANPEAFLDNNINKLRKGAVLRLDDPAAARAISRAAANREVARHNQNWSQTKQMLAEQGEARPQSTAPAKTSKSVASREAAKLKLVAPEGEAEAGGTGGSDTGEEAGVESVRKELMLALETAETQLQENEELQKRIHELEGQLESMQRLLSLKSDDMSQFQRQLASGEFDGPQADSAAATAAGDAEGKPSGEESDAPGESASGESAAVSSGEAPQPKTLELVEPAAEPQPEPAPKPEAKPLQAESPNPAPKPQPQPSPEPEPFYVALVDTVTDDPMMAGGVGFGALLLGLLAFTIRRRMNGGGFQESILSGGTSSMLNSKSSGDSSLETSLLSDLADDGMGGMPVQDSEVDPIAEADVYMAYGRHQQAEELLKDAMAQEPERHELLGKLMEVYYKTRNKQAFEAQSKAASAALNGSGPVWDRIVAMGHELAPENPLFAEAPENAEPVVEAEGDQAFGAMDDVLDIGLDLDALAAEMEPSETYGSGGNDEFDIEANLADIEAAMFEPDVTAGSRTDDGLSALDLGADASGGPDSEGDADLFGSFEPETGAPGAMQETASSEAEALAGLDFGDDAESAAAGSETADPLANLDFGLEGVATATEQPGDDNDALAGLDFGLGGDGAAETSDGLEGVSFGADETASSPDLDSAIEGGGADGGSGLEFNMEGFELPERDDAGDAAAEVQHDEGRVMDFDLGDFKVPHGDEVETPAPAVDIPVAGNSGEANPDFGREEETSADVNAEDAFGEFDFGEGLDEVGTKLDLATAYVEMGDAEGARDMLEEVLNEGDADQKQKAQELLDQITARA